MLSTSPCLYYDSQYPLTMQTIKCVVVGDGAVGKVGWDERRGWRGCLEGKGDSPRDSAYRHVS